MEVDKDIPGIFISYAHLDNESLIEGKPGWISSLHRLVEIRAGVFLGRKVRIWRDPLIPPNEPFPAEIERRLADSAVLVCVLSPRYVRSGWCQRELESFSKNGGRIFKVEKLPVDREKHPPELQELLGYIFYVKDPETGRPRELSLIFGPEDQHLYLKRLDDLAHDISKLLEKLEDGTPPRVEAASPEKTVYLAETSADLEGERDAVKRDLQRHGYTVLPDRELPRVASKVETFVREQLARCRLSIHLVGKNYGLVPDGTHESVVALQNTLAREQNTAAFSRLIWIPRGLQDEDIKDERQRQFVAHLRADPDTYRGAELLEIPLEDFKAVLHRTLNPPEPPRPAPRPPGGDDLTRIYLIRDQRDDEAAILPLGRYLFSQGFEVKRSLYDGDEEDVRTYHEDNLCDCDGALIYFGEGHELWLNRKLRELQKSAGRGRSKPLLATAVYVAPPATPEKEWFDTREALVIRPAAGAEPAEALAPFLKQIQQAKAGPAG